MFRVLGSKPFKVGTDPLTPSEIISTTLCEMPQNWRNMLECSRKIAKPLQPHSNFRRMYVKQTCQSFCTETEWRKPSQLRLNKRNNHFTKGLMEPRQLLLTNNCQYVIVISKPGHDEGSKSFSLLAIEISSRPQRERRKGPHAFFAVAMRCCTSLFGVTSA